jgi:hypothetical protein
MYIQAGGTNNPIDVYALNGTTQLFKLTGTGVACFASNVCAPAFVGGTLSGTTIYGSTAVCSPVGKFTTCLDLGGALTGTSATFSGNLAGSGYFLASSVTGLVTIQGNAGGSAFNQSQGLAIGWNYTAGGGEVAFSSNKGAGSVGGFKFYDWNGTTATQLLSILPSGATTFNNSGLFCSNLQTNGTLVIGNQSCAGTYFLNITPSTTCAVALQGSLAGVGIAAISIQPSGGNVGIGTPSPCYKLDIRNASGTGAQTIVSVVNKTNDSNTGAFIGFGDAYTDTVSPYLFAARVGGTREGAGDGGYMSFYTRPTSGFEYERMRITAGGIACFACQTCTPQSVITSGFYSNSNMIIITNDVVSGNKTILNNTPVSIFQICKPAGEASSASYSLLGGQLYINLGLRYNGGYNTIQTIIYPFLINSAGTGNISLVLGTPTCLTGFNNTGETTSFGISLCGSSNTTATVIVCANTPNFTIEGSTMITVSMVANRTALLDEPITVFKI